tara:strand:+ start:2913 stop:3758 length:846 start_codon:yes stop_codon:yes gene_type:complete
MQQDTSKKLHVVACVTDNYFDIYRDLFEKTLPHEFGSVILYHSRNSNSIPGAVATSSFKKINFEKLHFIRSQMNAFKGDNLLVLDLDIVFFRKFKNIILDLLKSNDMVFQFDTSDNHLANVGVWAMQCSDKNMDFFDKEILPRSYALLLSKDEYNAANAGRKMDIDKDWVLAWSPASPRTAKILSSHGKENYNCISGAWLPFDGDQCVVNASLLQPYHGHDLDIFLLDKAIFSQSRQSIGKSTVLYHAVGSKGKEKYLHMKESLKEVADEVVGSSNWGGEY